MRGVKPYILLFAAYFISLAAQGQYVQSMGYKDYSFWLQVNIGGQGAHTTDASAYLELGLPSGSTKGVLLPRGSKASVTSPAVGLMFYDLATNMPYYYNGSVWVGWGGDTATGASAALGYGLHYANDAIAVDTSLIGYKTWVTNYVTTAIDASNLDPYTAGFGLLLDDVLNKFSVDSSTMATHTWTTNEITNALAGFTVSFPNYSDTLHAYMKYSDTITLSNRIDAIADGTGLNLSFNNGLEKIMDEVHATYWNPMWNANRIQGFYVDATTPGNGYFLGFDSTAGIVRWMRPDSVLGSGVDLSAYYTKSESDARYLQTEADVVALAALIDTANDIRADMASLGGGGAGSAGLQEVLDNGYTLTHGSKIYMPDAVDLDMIVGDTTLSGDATEMYIGQDLFYLYSQDVDGWAQFELRPTHAIMQFGNFKMVKVDATGIQLKDGTEGDGKVWTSDAAGYGHWGDVSTPNINSILSASGSGNYLTAGYFVDYGAHNNVLYEQDHYRTEYFMEDFFRFTSSTDHGLLMYDAGFMPVMRNSNFNVTQNVSDPGYILNGNHTITMIDPTTVTGSASGSGQIVYVYARPGSFWTIAGATVQQPDGTAITSFAGGAMFQLMWSSADTAWIKMN